MHANATTHQTYAPDEEKWRKKKTIRLGTPLEAGNVLTCRNCNTSFRAGSEKKTSYECPFCFKQVKP
jgi:hypothetical protein